MGLAKLILQPLDGQLPLPVIALFNPKEYTISKSVPWNPQPSAGLDAPEMQFTTGQGETLTLELFFDTYEDKTPVSIHTKRLHQLALIDKSLHRPPMVLVMWSMLVFRGVVESISHRYTMFLESGIPVRATCSVTLREARDAKMQAQEQGGGLQSPDHAKLHAVRRGETLQSIAAAEYEDPAEWRRIADANGIDDPLRLQPGQRLMIPPILR
ncbi:LysM peptidoglycan-binding domain-containing protein [Myxococcota bacterium]|nr:LysM peptidoglycan-binding domain-containing protein [Myxococcota bacterium]